MDNKIYGQFKVLCEYDVVIAGGGTSGFAAAIAASRSGAKTLIIEEQAFLGGMSTGGMISQFMGFTNEEVSTGVKGVFGELLERLEKEKASTGIETIYLCGDKSLDVGAAPYDSETLKYIMDTMIKENNIDVLFHTKVIDVVIKDNTLEYIVVDNSETFLIRAKVFIDSTFHATVAYKCGCQWNVGDENNAMQPGTLMFKMSNIDEKKVATFTREQNLMLAKKGIEEGNLFVNNILSRPIGNGTYYSNSSRVSVNPFDGFSWSNSEMEGRQQVQKIYRFFVNNVPGYENAILSSTGTYVGLRDSRRIIGKYTLTKEDVLGGTEFEDAVVSSSYPVDIHDPNGTGSKLYKPKTGIFYIPFRCMIGEINNLIFTGRCISADYYAHAAIRVMVTCMKLGEAAGKAAALSIHQNIQVNKFDGSLISIRNK